MRKQTPEMHCPVLIEVYGTDGVSKGFRGPCGKTVLTGEKRLKCPMPLNYFCQHAAAVGDAMEVNTEQMHRSLHSGRARPARVGLLQGQSKETGKGEVRTFEKGIQINVE